MKTDNVRLSLVALTVVVCVGAAALAAGARAAQAATPSIKGQVLYANQPAAKIKITLDGPAKKETTSDAKGEFVFNDLPAGEYKLEARGTAKNSIRKGNAKVTVADSAKEPAVATIKLN